MRRIWHGPDMQYPYPDVIDDRGLADGQRDQLRARVALVIRNPDLGGAAAVGYVAVEQVTPPVRGRNGRVVQGGEVRRRRGQPERVRRYLEGGRLFAASRSRDRYRYYHRDHDDRRYATGQYRPSQPRTP